MEEGQRNKCSAVLFGLFSGVFGRFAGGGQQELPLGYERAGLRSSGGAQELPDYQELDEVDKQEDKEEDDEGCYRPEERPPSPIGSSGSDEEPSSGSRKKGESVFTLSEEEISAKKEQVEIPEKDDELFSAVNKDGEEWGEDVTIDFGNSTTS